MGAYPVVQGVMRTTWWHLVKLAWALYNRPDRKHLRIGQMLWYGDSFYYENDEFIKGIQDGRDKR